MKRRAKGEEGKREEKVRMYCVDIQVSEEDDYISARIGRSDAANVRGFSIGFLKLMSDCFVYGRLTLLMWSIFPLSTFKITTLLMYFVLLELSIVKNMTLELSSHFIPRTATPGTLIMSGQNKNSVPS